ncbi:FG-GAP repeat domain-containing protein [Actinomadura yumaensis]|uniref:FG-GAP repeat domain-containing protein n=1 Tax=Actinomadura yumaensis TaxID=111807 RepID=UPI0036185FD1
MKRRSLIAIGAVVTVGLGAAGAGALDDDGTPKAASVTSTPSAAGSLRPVTPARPVTFTKPAKRADFNGDGYRDLIDPFVNPGQGPGLLTVVYGSPEGPTSGRHQSIGPSVPGVPGDAQVGWTVATADFDRDGYADLAVDTVTLREPARSVPIVIFYGSATGLTGRSVVLKSPVGDSVDSMAAGDFDGAGGMDLVVTGEGTSWVFRDITTKPVKAAKIPVTGRTGDRVRRRSVGPAAHAWARDPVVADVNGDHRSDLVLVVETPAADGEEERVSGTPNCAWAPPRG